MSDDPRISYYRSLGVSIGENVFLGPDVYIEHDFAALLTIEDGVVISRGVSILLHDSALNNVAGVPIKFGKVILRKNCYIGANSLILCGVDIGVHSLVGAGSLVTTSIPANMVVYGHPARIICHIDELVQKQSQKENSPLTFYLDLPIWRDRRDPEAASTATQQIDTFLKRVMNLSEVKDEEDDERS